MGLVKAHSVIESLAWHGGYGTGDVGHWEIKGYRFGTLGMIRYGMTWYDMVWYGMVWYGMVWYIESLPDVVK
jgi:hypothetical protein